MDLAASNLMRITSLMFTDPVRVGKGTYGTVYKATHSSTGQIVALKQIELASEREGIPCTAVREMSILSRLNHKNIVKLLFTFHNAKLLTLVFEYCPQDLCKFMTRKRLASLEIISFAFQLLSAVAAMHRESIVHRDIKPHNVLITEKGVLKLCDFGLARVMNVPHDDLSLDVVTQWYRAPEIMLKDRDYGFPCDIWSVGCVIVEMATGRPLFPCSEDSEQLQLICGVLEKDIDIAFPNKAPPLCATPCTPLDAIMQKCDSRITHLVVSLLQFNPNERVSAAEALNFPVFHEVI